MANEQLEAFLSQIKTDASLQANLKQAYAEALISTAKQAGYTISIEQLRELESKVSDEELLAASGGHITIKEPPDDPGLDNAHTRAQTILKTIATPGPINPLQHQP